MSIDLQALLEKAIHEATVNQDDAYFITLQDAQHKPNWLQLTGEAINAYYPYKEMPLQKVAALGLPAYPGLAVSTWEPELYVTFSHPANAPAAVVAFIKAYLEQVLDYTGDGESWLVSFE